ncbi:MAG: hypothetical protein GC136_01435 [Alphaproteobacteria bacterium]|nr:hypothetical protein [Alphaproteobacteria bacterium]
MWPLSLLGSKQPKFNQKKFETELRNWFQEHIVENSATVPANGLFYARQYLQEIPADQRLSVIENDILRNPLFVDYFSNITEHLENALTVLRVHVPENDKADFDTMADQVVYRKTVELPATDISEPMPADVLFNNLVNWVQGRTAPDGVTFVAVAAPILANGRPLTTPFGLAAQYPSLEEPLTSFFTRLSTGEDQTPAWVQAAAQINVEIIQSAKPT